MRRRPTFAISFAAFPETNFNPNLHTSKRLIYSSNFSYVSTPSLPYARSFDELGVDAMAGDTIERTVVGGPVDAPEAGIADIGEPWAELVAQQPEQPEHRICIGVVARNDVRPDARFGPFPAHDP